MSHSMLPPPPPRFPQTFDARDVPASDRVGLAAMDEVESRDRDQVGTQPNWSLRTEQEEHLHKLEVRLSRLSNRASHPRPTPDLNDSLASDDEVLEACNERGEAAGHDDEGRPLLPVSEEVVSHNPDSAHHDQARQVRGPEEESRADLSNSDEENRPEELEKMTAAQRISFSNSVRISGGIHTRPHRHQRPPLECFPRRAPSMERSGSTSRDARPETAPSPLLVASVTSSNLNSPSRATSPSGSGRTLSSHSTPSLNVIAPKPRRLSSSSHLSSSFSHPTYAYYSASPGSQVASRGSSPCSSIYAPLQPPSKHTPNPLFVRPAPRLQRQRSGSSGLSFQEYLREGYDAFDASDDDDSDAVASVSARSPGYRELVEQQRRKRAQWEQRKRRRVEENRRKQSMAQGSHGPQEADGEGSGFWSGVKRFFAVGTNYGSGAGRAGGALGSPSIAFRNAARPATRPAKYGATDGRTSRDSSARRSGSPITVDDPARRTTTQARPRSILAVSHVPPAPVVPAEAAPPNDQLPRAKGRSRSQSSRSEPPSALPPSPPAGVAKTELETRFGPAPFRYFKMSYLVYKVRRLVAAVKDVFSTASKGLAKQKERERLSRDRRRQGERGYEAV